MQIEEKIRVYVKVLGKATYSVVEELKQVDDAEATGSGNSERYFVTMLDRTKNQEIHCKISQSLLDLYGTILNSKNSLPAD